MARKRKSPEPIKPTRGLQLVPAPARSSLGINEAEADELRELIRSITQKKKSKEQHTDDDEPPTAA